MEEWKLTANVEWCSESCSYLRVEFNDKIAIFSKLIVAFLDIDIHEVLDWLPNDSVDDVDDILPRKTMTVFLVWKVVLHTRVLQPFFKERFNAKSFIERSEEDLDVSS